MYEKQQYSKTLRDFALTFKIKLNDRNKRANHKLYQRVFKSFMFKIIDRLMTEAYVFNIPYNSGRLYYKSVKGTKFVNTYETIRQRKIVFYDNSVTGDKMYRIEWEVPYNYPNQDLYSFKTGSRLRKYIYKKLMMMIKNRTLPVPFKEIDNKGK